MYINVPITRKRSSGDYYEDSYAVNLKDVTLLDSERSGNKYILVRGINEEGKLEKIRVTNEYFDEVKRMMKRCNAYLENLWPQLPVSPPRCPTNTTTNTTTDTNTPDSLDLTNTEDNIEEEMPRVESNMDGIEI